jgi:hypothetical protein
VFILKKLEDIREQVHITTVPTARVLFKKVSKAVDQRDFVIA